MTVSERPELLQPPALRQALGLSREAFSRVLHVSAKTVERWEKGDTLPSSLPVRRQLAQLREIVDLGTIVYTPEGLQWFMTTPFPVFGGRTGLEMVEWGEADAVFAALASDYEGLGG